jgi:hypothetical protein
MASVEVDVKPRDLEQSHSRSVQKEHNREFMKCDGLPPFLTDVRPGEYVESFDPTQPDDVQPRDFTNDFEILESEDSSHKVVRHYYSPDRSKYMDFFQCSRRMSIYLSNIWYYMVVGATPTDVLPYGHDNICGSCVESPETPLPKGLCRCHEVDLRIQGFGQTTDGWPRVADNIHTLGWRALKLDTKRHFKNKGFGALSGDGCEDVILPTLAKQLALSRVAYAATVMEFAQSHGVPGVRYSSRLTEKPREPNKKGKRGERLSSRDKKQREYYQNGKFEKILKPGSPCHISGGKRVPTWFWPFEWTRDEYRRKITDPHLHTCSHLCHNKMCISTAGLHHALVRMGRRDGGECGQHLLGQHIVVEPLVVNLSRQNGPTHCSGYIVPRQDWKEYGNYVGILGYHCIHRFGCRCITMIEFNESENLEMLNSTELYYRNNHPQQMKFSGH